MASYEWGYDHTGRDIYLPYYYFLVNLAALLGIWDEARGVHHAVWTHVRSG